MNFLEGQKTYILCAFALVIIILGHFGIISTENITFLLQIAGVGTVATMRSAVNKV